MTLRPPGNDEHSRRAGRSRDPRERTSSGETGWTLPRRRRARRSPGRRPCPRGVRGGASLRGRRTPGGPGTNRDTSSRPDRDCFPMTIRWPSLYVLDEAEHQTSGRAVATVVYRHGGGWERCLPCNRLGRISGRSSGRPALRPRHHRFGWPPREAGAGVTNDRCHDIIPGSRVHKGSTVQP